SFFSFSFINAATGMIRDTTNPAPSATKAKTLISVVTTDKVRLAKEKQEKLRQKKLISESFEKADAPKNWNYFMRVNEKYD
ncbi:hypothetical protein ACSLN1_26545, partial [Escherichia coli]